MTTSLNLPQADFGSIKQALQQYLAAQGQFADFNFEGSNISAFVDLLSYNTYIKNFYHNMATTETFADVAKLRTNVVARAQENGYVPRSFTSATAVVNFTIVSSNVNRSSVVIPKGTSVTTRIDNRAFTFITTEPIITSITEQTASTVTFAATNVRIAEGFIVGDSFIYNSDSDLFSITNEQVDTSSLTVTVIEDQTVATEYKLAKSSVGVDSADAVYFLRVGPDGRYSVYFGNGVIGRKPKLGSLVVLEYRVSNGQLANGAFVFKPGDDIDGETNITVTTAVAATGGDIYETVESIRFNGRQANITQGRSVYEEDFKQDIEAQFPYIVDINVVGGESINPPAYGRIVITAVVDDEVNPSAQEIEEITQFVSERSPLTTRPIFTPANIIRLGVDTKIRRTNAKTYDYIRSVVAAAIDDYNTNAIGKFARPAIKSKLSTAIDAVDSSIIGNSTDLTMIVRVSTNSTVNVNYGNAVASLTSQEFIFQGNKCTVGADADGSIFVYNVATGEKATVTSVGTINYSTGVVAFTVNEKTTQRFDLIATPVEDDINCSANMVLKINQSDVTIR